MKERGGNFYVRFSHTAAVSDHGVLNFTTT